MLSREDARGGAEGLSTTLRGNDRKEAREERGVGRGDWRPGAQGRAFSQRSNGAHERTNDRTGVDGMRGED